MNSFNLRTQWASWAIYISIGVFLACRSSNATGQALSQNLESASVRDISLSLLRDNYDIWAGEMMNKVLVEHAKTVGPLQDEIDKLTTSEKSISEKVRSRLIELYTSTLVDETSVRAALLLAKLSSSKDKAVYLQNAFRMAESLSPGSLQTLRLALLNLSEMMAVRNFAGASKFVSRVLDLAEQRKLQSTSESCFSFLLAGDIEFESTNFSAADKFYRKSLGCFEKSDNPREISHLSQLLTRIAWSSFRLMKYSETLTLLEQLVALPETSQLTFSAAVKADLAVTLGVSLSELSLPLPPSFWLSAIGRHPWIADGLVKSIRYIVYKEDTRRASRWVETLESQVARLPVALEFYSVGIEALEKDGLVERANELRARAVLALHPHTELARSLSFDPAGDLRRRTMASQWARLVITQRAQQEVMSLNKSAVTDLYRVAEALYEDNTDVCSEVRSFVTAHRVLAAAVFESFAEKVHQWFMNCSNLGTLKREVALSRLEMFRALAKGNGKNKSSWSSYLQLALQSLEEFKADGEIRRVTLEALGDAIELGRLDDAERLMLLHVLTVDQKSESAQWEFDGLVSASVRLLTSETVSPSLEAAGWSLHRMLSKLSSAFDEKRQRLDAALAFHVSRLALESRQHGKLQQAIFDLSENAGKFAIDSVYGRDLLFQAVRLSCLSAVEQECLLLSERMLTVPSAPPHDLFLVSKWRAESFYRRGNFNTAARLWLDSAQYAIDSGRAELISLAKSDVIRAGDVFSELKFWNESLEARAVLTKVSAVSGISVGTHAALLRWSLWAHQNQANDFAAALATDLQAWMNAESIVPRGSRKQPNVMEIVTQLTEVSTRTISNAGSPMNYQNHLLDALEIGRKNEGVFFRADGKLNALTVTLLSNALNRWHQSQLQASDAVSRRLEVSQIDDTLRFLTRSFDDLVRACQLASGQKIILKQHAASCLTDVSRSFSTYATRINSALMQGDGLGSARVQALDGRLNVFLNRVAALSIPAARRSALGEATQGQVLERRNKLFGLSEPETIKTRGAQ